MTLVVEPMGELALRFEIAAGVERRALLARLRAIPGTRSAHLSETHACVAFEGEPPMLDASIFEASAEVEVPAPRAHVVRVIYDGPDLEETAALAELDREELIARHVACELSVSFVGFLPGFGYLRGLDEVLARIPRRRSPRARVPAGSVAIAGGFAGIYPFDSPGGWQLLGRALEWAPLAGDAPRLAIGDRVRFERAQ